MKWLFFITLISLNLAFTSSNKKPIRVAIIDTGLDLKDPRFKDVLCADGHKDFTGEGITDVNGHGTHVAGLIKEHASNSNYCMVIYKYYPTKSLGTSRVSNELKAFKESIISNIDLVNFSSGGGGFNDEESQIIKNNSKITFVVAAGNEGQDLDIVHFYPASYHLKNIVIVGNVKEDNTREEHSNWSNFEMVWEMGTNVLSTLPNGKNGYDTGTSMSAAIRTGKIIRKLSNAK